MTRVEGLGVDPVAVSVPRGFSPAPAGSPCWKIYNWLCTASVGGRGELAARLVVEPMNPLDDRGRAGRCRVYTVYPTLRGGSGPAQVETVKPERGMQKG